jgi:hypothetical protein
LKVSHAVHIVYEREPFLHRLLTVHSHTEEIKLICLTNPKRPFPNTFNRVQRSTAYIQTIVNTGTRIQYHAQCQNNKQNHTQRNSALRPRASQQKMQAVVQDLVSKVLVASLDTRIALLEDPALQTSKPQLQGSLNPALV